MDAQIDGLLTKIDWKNSLKLSMQSIKIIIILKKMTKLKEEQGKVKQLRCTCIVHLVKKKNRRNKKSPGWLYIIISIFSILNKRYLPTCILFVTRLTCWGHHFRFSNWLICSTFDLYLQPLCVHVFFTFALFIFL